jgi:hypothetical protein
LFSRWLLSALFLEALASFKKHLAFLRCSFIVRVLHFANPTPNLGASPERFGYRSGLGEKATRISYKSSDISLGTTSQTTLIDDVIH